jgi:hypothetical protein
LTRKTAHFRPMIATHRGGKQFGANQDRLMNFRKSGAK